MPNEMFFPIFIMGKEMSLIIVLFFLDKNDWTNKTIEIYKWKYKNHYYLKSKFFVISLLQVEI